VTRGGIIVDRLRFTASAGGLQVEMTPKPFRVLVALAPSRCRGLAVSVGRGPQCRFGRVAHEKTGCGLPLWGFADVADFDGDDVSGWAGDGAVFGWWRIRHGDHQPRR
jgi:hypothetical protein